MTHDEAKSIVKTLAGLFPNQLTQDQARYAAKELRAFDAAAAEKAIRLHRGQHEFINWPNLWEGCRAAARDGKASAVNAGKEGNWTDVYRRQNGELRSASDLEVILRVHRGWWYAAKKGYENAADDGPELASYRTQFRSSCVNKVRGVSPEMTDAVACQWADTIFYPPEDFRHVLEDLRRPAAA